MFRGSTDGAWWRCEWQGQVPMTSMMVRPNSGIEGLGVTCDLRLVIFLAVISTASVKEAFNGPTHQHFLDPTWPQSLNSCGLGLSTFVEEEKGWLPTLRVVLVTQFSTKKIRTKSDNKQKSTRNPIPLSNLNMNLTPSIGGQGFAGFRTYDGTRYIVCFMTVLICCRKRLGNQIRRVNKMNKYLKTQE